MANEQIIPQSLAPGFYWVKLNFKDDWEVAEFFIQGDHRVWFFCGRGAKDEYDEENIIEIYSSRLLPPVEQPYDGTHPNQWGAELMSLSSKTNLPDSPKVNVWDIKTKQIVFTGDTQAAGAFMGCTPQNVFNALRSKARVQNKWAVRAVKSNV